MGALAQWIFNIQSFDFHSSSSSGRNKIIIVAQAHTRSLRSTAPN